MPYGTGTYGSKVGRPPKKKNKAKRKRSEVEMYNFSGTRN